MAVLYRYGQQGEGVLQVTFDCSMEEAILLARKDDAQRQGRIPMSVQGDGRAYSRFDILRLTDFADGQARLVMPQQNPFWDEVLRIRAQFNSEWTTFLYRRRRELADKYAWAVPNPEAVRFVLPPPLPEGLSPWGRD